MKVLLVKLSSLGDVVHTLPVVQDILTAMPHAKIDWVVEKSFAPVLTEVQGLHRVIACELRNWRKSPFANATHAAWAKFKTDLQRDSYDAVIDLQGLTKSALVARLARLAPGGKRYAMANRTDGSAYEVPTRWVADVAVALQPRQHAVQRGRDLAARSLAYQPSAGINYGLKVPVAQLEQAQEATKTIAFVHGTSRADKEWPLQNWFQLGKQFNAAGYQVAMVHGSAKELATSRAIAAQIDAVVWPILGLDAVTRELRHCAGAIGVDSGVSHIAVALGLPHVQIYNFDTAWRTGPVLTGNQVSVFARPSPSADAVWQAWQRCHRQEAGALQ